MTALLVLAAGAAAAALLVLSVCRRPQNGLLLLAALTPFNGLLAIVPGGSSLAGWKEGVLGVSLLAAGVRWWGQRREHGGRLRLWAPWLPALVGLVVLGTASALLTLGVVGLVALKVTFLWTAVLLVLALAPFDALDRDRLVTVLMVVAPVTAAVGLWQQWVGGQALVDLGYEWNVQVRTAGGVLRSFGTSGLPFPYALLLTLSLVVGGAVALSDPRRPRNAVFLALVPLVVAGMAVSIVRASYIGTLVGLVWIAAVGHRPGHRRLWVVLGALGVAALGVLAFVPVQLLTPLFSSSSFGERSTGWSSIVGDVLSHPFGQGLGSTGSAAVQVAEATGASTADLYQPDSYWVKMVVELGPLGLWLYAAILVSGCSAALHASRRAARAAAALGAHPADAAQRLALEADAALCLGVSASVVSSAVAATVATYLEIFPLDLYFWLLLGVVGCVVLQLPRTAAAGAGRQLRAVS